MWSPLRCGHIRWAPSFLSQASASLVKQQPTADRFGNAWPLRDTRNWLQKTVQSFLKAYLKGNCLFLASPSRRIMKVTDPTRLLLMTPPRQVGSGANNKKTKYKKEREKPCSFNSYFIRSRGCKFLTSFSGIQMKGSGRLRTLHCPIKPG